MILTIGSSGQLGSALISACTERAVSYAGLTHDSIGVQCQQSVETALGGLSFVPTAVINTAALHNVEDCENEPQWAFSVNCYGSANVARWCRDHGSKYVFVSSDYVAGEPTDASGLPLSVYAKSKLAGELSAMSICPDGLVVRVGTMYGVSGCRAKNNGNLIDTLVGKIKAQEPFTLPAYTNVPITSAKRAAQRILSNLDYSGVWYATDPCGNMSHYQLGQLIARYLKLPDNIMAVSKDPNDTLRPHTVNVGKLLPWTTCPAKTVPDFLYEYLVEKGHIDA